MSRALPQVSFVLAWLAAVPAARAEASLDVPTLSGVVRGQPLGARREWRGIPYAAPPKEDLRWRPPAPPLPWDRVREASQFGPHCLQPAWPDGLVGDEDCLYLNVSAPLQAAPGSNLPVIVDIHGGGDVGGWGQEETGSLVRHDVIVVTFNYRLGVLGFLAHPLLTAEGGGTSSNYGLMDCIAAFEWVHDNIAAFGGDPGNVTLSGFSSGAGNGFVLAVSPLTRGRGLFQRAVLSSWEIFQSAGIGQELAGQELEGEWHMQPYGCEASADPLGCLREIDAARLAEDWRDINPQGTTETDILPEGALFLARRYGTVPLLVTSVPREEGWIIDDPFIPDPMSESDFSLWIADLFGSQHTGTIRRLYPESEYEGDRRAAYVDLFHDVKYHCAMRGALLAASSATADHPAAPAYRWVFTHELENAWWVERYGVTHGDDMTLLWQWDYYPRTRNENELSLMLSRYVTNFAKRGDPNGSGLPSWPLFTPDRQAYLDVRVDSIAGERYHAEECDALDTMLDEVFQSCGALCRVYFRGNERFFDSTHGFSKRVPDFTF